MARTSRLPLIAVLCTALVAAGCSLPFVDERKEPAPRPPAAAAGQWRDCPEVAKQLVGRGAPDMTYQCATVSVPRDWAAPRAAGPAGASAGSTGPAAGSTGQAAAAGKTFDIALLRARSTRQRDRIGSLILNPGGPGGSGIDTAIYLSFGPKFGGIPEEVSRRFDIVGFDPRGVGRSSPIKCISDGDLDATFGFEPDPVDKAEFDELVALNRRIGAGCAAKYGADLPLYSTEQAARDMDAVRAAVGDEKITYLGYSYGTLLGATYAQLYPKRIRAFVLDGAVDPKADAIVSSESQAKGFELAFNNFAAWCDRTPRKCPIGPDARTAVTTILDKARSSPVRGARGREATAGWVFYAIVSSLYTEAGWEKLAEALAKLVDGAPAETFKLADDYARRDAAGHYTNFFDAFYAVNCADSARPVTVDQIRTLQARWRAKYPLFGAPLAVGLLPCLGWPGARDPYPTGAATGAPPIVVVGTTGDPATPYEQTALLAGMLGVGRVLTWEGEGHTAYPESRCITEAVNRYLIDLRVPEEGKRCPAR
ncbi:MAG TPA: alpha/beta hydrolase [Pilimelia sp.]|nr:alpha/beta hydrolase [Pilimelia sp.]